MKMTILLFVCLVVMGGCGLYATVNNSDADGHIKIGMTKKAALADYSNSHLETFQSHGSQVDVYKMRTSLSYHTLLFFIDDSLVATNKIEVGEDYSRILHGDAIRDYFNDSSPFITSKKPGRVKIKAVGLSNSRNDGEATDKAEAEADAMRRAIEKAGISIKSETMITNGRLDFATLQIYSQKYIPAGYEIIDIGYKADGVTYQVVFVGEVLVN